MADLKWSGYDRLIARLGAIADPDANPLMEEWETIVREDNRDGALRGVDKDDVAYKPVTYRPKGATTRPTKRQRNYAPADRRGIFAGMGPSAAGLNNNLTSAEYRRVAGPPLAPRGPNSRIITNLVTDHTTRPVGGIWSVFGMWEEVVSTKGVAFYPYLFPIRDPRGVRKAGRAKALTAAKRWLVTVVRGP